MTGSIGRLAVKLIGSTAALSVVGTLGLSVLTPATPAEAAAEPIVRGALLRGSDLRANGFVKADTTHISLPVAEDEDCVKPAAKSTGFGNSTSRVYQGAHTIAYETVIRFRSGKTAHRYVQSYVRGMESCSARRAQHHVTRKVSRTHHPRAGGSETVAWTGSDNSHGAKVNQSANVMRSGESVAVLTLFSPSNKPWRVVDIEELRCLAMWRVGA